MDFTQSCSCLIAYGSSSILDSIKSFFFQHHVHSRLQIGKRSEVVVFLLSKDNFRIGIVWLQCLREVFIRKRSQLLQSDDSNVLFSIHLLSSLNEIYIDLSGAENYLFYSFFVFVSVIKNFPKFIRFLKFFYSGIHHWMSKKFLWGNYDQRFFEFPVDLLSQGVEVISRVSNIDHSHIAFLFKVLSHFLVFFQP